jgi:CheY-like chemotaxis protein
MAYDRLRDARVLVVDDDRPFCESVRMNLEDVGAVVTAVLDVASAERAIDSAAQPFDVALVDLYLPDRIEDPYDRIMRGEQLAYTCRKRTPQTRVIGMSEHIERVPFTPVKDVFSGFLYKNGLSAEATITALLETVDGILISERRRTPRMFIVHGHDSTLLLELKNFVQNSLKLGEPIVLRERPSQGRTVIEKFEHESRGVDVVFVLMTPDDRLATDRMRTRQNVIFELGFFYAKLQRTTGRVFLLASDGIEFPSDISGIVFLDVRDGVSSASETIRGELAALGWLD